MSSYKTESYLWVDDLSAEGTQQIFQRAKAIKNQLKTGPLEPTLQGRQIALVFSEASTRTKMSFQMAAQRLGAQCLVIDNVKSSSMSKGETFEDTFWTLHSIRPDIFVIRCGGHEPLESLVEKSEIPIVNGGFGSVAHPTQALLDTFTMQEYFGSLKGLKVLFVGDLDHSRVAQSNFKLLTQFAVDVGVCAPAELSKNMPSSFKKFETLDEAVQWCDVYVGLRVQFERHVEKFSKEFTKEDYVKNYGLNKECLKKLNKDAVIMHPGPVNWAIEFQDEVKTDPRLLMWSQKENGVYVRAALMETILRNNS